MRRADPDLGRSDVGAITDDDIRGAVSRKASDAGLVYRLTAEFGNSARPRTAA